MAPHRPDHETERPRAAPVSPGVDRFVDELRASRFAPPDEVSLARMERSLVQRWRTQAARVAPLRSRARGLHRAEILPMGLAAAAATVLVVLGVRAMMADAPERTQLGAQFEMRLSEGALQRGLLNEGQTLESGRHGHIQVDMATTRIEVEPRSRVRFDRLLGEQLQLTVIEGQIEAHFNRDHEAGQHLAVETRSARIEVVGTRFTVLVDGQGDTHVAVREGVVDVIPRVGQRRRLHAGESMAVLFDAGNATERAVREAITARLAQPSTTEADSDDQGASGIDSLPVVLAGHRGVGARADLMAGGASRTLSESGVSGDQVVGSGPLDQLERARSMLLAGRHAGARRQLQKVARNRRVPPAHRAEALTLLAESYTVQGQIPKAAKAYHRAAEVAPGTSLGHNALFARARLYERYTRDKAQARSAYESYLNAAPRGPLSGQARGGLCRLGAAEYCAGGPSQ